MGRLAAATQESSAGMASLAAGMYFMQHPPPCGTSDVGDERSGEFGDS
jgi:hypothetical protein